MIFVTFSGTGVFAQSINSTFSSICITVYSIFIVSIVNYRLMDFALVCKFYLTFPHCSFDDADRPFSLTPSENVVAAHTSLGKNRILISIYNQRCGCIRPILR